MMLEVGETDLDSFLKARGDGLSPALVLFYGGEKVGGHRLLLLR